MSAAHAALPTKPEGAHLTSLRTWFAGQLSAFKHGINPVLVDFDAGVEAAILGLKKPTVAVIRTWCIGGGLATALNCDLRFAAENTRFAVPAARLGLGYRYAGIRTLVDIVGAAAAREIFFTARQYDAEEALRMGLISRTAPVEGFEAAAKEYLSQIAGNAPLTVAAAKMAINVALEDKAERDLTEVDAAVAACFASEDYEEGRRAFREKRKPQFKGR